MKEVVVRSVVEEIGFECASPADRCRDGAASRTLPHLFNPVFSQHAHLDRRVPQTEVGR